MNWNDRVVRGGQNPCRHRERTEPRAGDSITIEVCIDTGKIGVFGDQIRGHLPEAARAQQALKIKVLRPGTLLAAQRSGPAPYKILLVDAKPALERIERVMRIEHR